MLEDMEARWLSGCPLDVPSYTALANMISRTLRTLGLERRQRDVTPDLATYVADRATDDVPGKRSAHDNPTQPPRPRRPPRPKGKRAASPLPTLPPGCELP
jgi:hypothetical protein